MVARTCWPTVTARPSRKSSPSHRVSRCAEPAQPRARRRYIRPCLPVEPAARVERLRWLLGVAEAEARQAAPDATRDIGQTYTWQPGGWVAQYAAAVEGD